MVYVICAPLSAGSGASVFVTVRSGRLPVGVLVGVLVGVFVGVLVGVFVGVLVGVFVGVLVGVLVDVLVAVGVLVGVFVGVSVGVRVLVGVSVAVGVGVLVAVDVSIGVDVTVGVSAFVGVPVDVGVAVGPSTDVLIVTELFDSRYSGMMFAGSTVAVLSTLTLDALVTKPSIVIVAKAPTPVPSVPRSQSSRPPVIDPSIAQMPRVVLKPV
jgi:hypothetical protein